MKTKKEISISTDILSGADVDKHYLWWNWIESDRFW